MKWRCHSILNQPKNLENGEHGWNFAFMWGAELK